MTDCANLDGCSFFATFKERSTDPDFADLAIKGLVRMYCKGSKQDKCIRKIVSQKLGSNRVPTNLMPIGLALADTTDQNWPDDVVSIIQEAKRR